MDKTYLTIDDVRQDITEKLVFCRVDTNTTLRDGNIHLNERIHSAAATIKRLTDLHVKVIVGTHNGRKGGVDMVTLTDLVYRFKGLGVEIHYVGNSYEGQRPNEPTMRAIRDVQPGYALLLENLRFLESEDETLSPEAHARHPFVRTLIDELGLAYVVNDAFSVAHRAHMSVCGFDEIPNVAGLTMDRELSSMATIHDHFQRREPGKTNVYILGGKKVQDYFSLLEHSLRNGKVDRVLAGGYLGLLCLFVQGKAIGQETTAALQKKGLTSPLYRDKMQVLLTTYPENFVVPVDLAYDVKGARQEVLVDDQSRAIKDHARALDIGHRTTEMFASALQNAGLIYVKGPLGVYESPQFNYGSRSIMNAVATSEGFSVMGGGDTSAMLDEFKIRKDEINHISLAGGALILAMADQKLPGVETLQRSYERYKKR